MFSYSIQQISQIIGGKASGNMQAGISNLLIDSRVITAPEVSLFFALTGPNHNGHDFIPELYQRGVRAFVISEESENIGDYQDAATIRVSNTLRALQELAAHHRRNFDCPVIGITGSNGKTIVKEWLYHCLEGSQTITRSPKSYNSQVGVPLSLWLLDGKTEVGIFEAGISMPGEMKHLQRMIKPDIGILTNIGEAHQENFLNLEQKIDEKLRLFHGCKTLIYCQDHQQVRTCIQNTPELAGVELFSWSSTGKAELQITGLARNKGFTRIRGHFRHQPVEVTIPYTDNASIDDAVHCLSMLLLLDADMERIQEKMLTLPPVAMRLEQKSGINGCTLINDSYNSDITSLSIALDVLQRQLQHKKTTLILSDILQSGKKKDELYSMVSSLMTEKKVSRIIGIGDDIYENNQLFIQPGCFFRTTEAFLQQFDPDDFQHEGILVKGSRQFGFERISALLELKKNTSRIEINLSALVHNLNYYRSLLHPITQIMVMVKAFSYGSGRHEIASVLQHHLVNYLGVAFADEGVSLRKAGITLPVMVMNPEPESFGLIIQYRLEPEIYSLRNLLQFNELVNRNQEVDYPVHIKVDTGMHRLGFLETEIDQLCKALGQCGNIRVRTVFSHLAGSDEQVFDDFTAQQVRIFQEVSKRIEDSIGYPVRRHILNSSGIERFPDAQYDMVRLGIGLYGISPTHPEKLRNVCTLKSTILQVKQVSKGETVGYSRAGKAERDSKIAVIPIGYADGLNRHLSNGIGRFLVNGQFAPVIGNICMDMTMIDVTDIEVMEGDDVIIFGDGLPVSQLAETLGTIPYEILTNVSERVKRIYFHE